MTQTLMLVAAEASGDALGAELIREIRTQSPGRINFCGVGGVHMREEGVISPFDISELSILGLIEGIKAYGRVKQRVADTVKLALETRPQAVVLIDSWGFTLRVAKAIRKVLPETRLIKYVAPQVWASRPGRAKTLAKSVDLLLSTQIFDAPFFEKEGLKTVFVGNRALNLNFEAYSGDGFRARHGLSAEALLLMILPGSRPSEITRMLPVFEQTARLLKARLPNLNLVMPVADTVKDRVLGEVSTWPMRVIMVQEDADKIAAMKASNLALACSGTVSLELAVAGVPMVIGYRIDNLTYFILKHIITTPYITLFNIAAKAFVAPEFVQDACHPAALAAACLERLENPDQARRQVEEQFRALDLMGRGGQDPSILAAKAVLTEIGSAPALPLGSPPLLGLS